MTQDINKQADLINTLHKKDLNSSVNNSYIIAATSVNTRIAYQSDIRQFERWGGKLPATSEIIIEYLKWGAVKLNARTLERRIIALRHWHTYQGFLDPTNHAAIKKTLQGIKRIHGKPKAKAHPLLIADLRLIVMHLQQENSFAAVRDNALLQVGFFAALRRSELVSLNVSDVKFKEEGMELLITHSKTDQTNEGQYCALPFGKALLCPVQALKNWLAIAKVAEGPIFRQIKKGAKITQVALTPLSINLILKKRAKEVNLSFANQLSGHSLRRGLATSAAKANASISAIMRQGRWKNVNTVMEYVEETERFKENVMLKILA